MIREIREADVGSVTAIYNHYVEYTPVTYEEEVLTRGEMLARVKQTLNAGYPWLVAEDGGRVVGYCYACRWKERSAYRYTAEVTVYLAPDAVGKGWGTRLYAELFARLGKMGIRSAIGGISLPNAASVALHEKMGMKQVALLEKVGYKFGQWLDVGYWHTELGQFEAQNDADQP